jgi:tetratricopeptide (TPR) repeat protein
MIRIGLVLFITLFALTLTHAVAAQKRQPGVSYADWREARNLFNQGHLAYSRGDYEEAIVKWEKSRQLSKEPLIHESIANAYERLGDAPRALENLEIWRKHAPKQEHRALDQRLERLRDRVAKEEEEARERKLEEERQRKVEEERRRREQAEARRRRIEEQHERLVAEDRSQIIGWSVVGVGGAAVIAGVALDVAAAGQRPNEAEVCTAQTGQLLCRADVQSEIETSNAMAIAGDALWIGGAAVAATGVVLLFALAPPSLEEMALEEMALEEMALEDTEGDAYAVPLVGPSLVGIGISGQF